MSFRRILSVLLILTIGLSSGPSIYARAQGGDPATRARVMLGRMTPEERVGQLFLVSFAGSTADQNSQIYDLIVRHHVGGVVLLAGNDNFVAAPDTVPAAYRLISQLQNAEWESSQPSTDPNATPATSNYIPLFVGIGQSGDGSPNDQILSGLTPLPSLMALGATWNPDLAEQTGAVAGEELSSIGFNLYIGPALDVLESPESNVGNGLGSSAFGGDPYWVGSLGSAYITGLHTGSDGRLLVIADHFPGRGSSDRPIGEEPATVRSSLEQLKQIELAPYFAVTGNAQSALAAADGLLVSHIRYQGFQGNIRSTTRPVSFDPQALSQILSLPAFAQWRTNGGVMVSGDLGSPTVRRFYSPSGQTFTGRLVARDAFLAGNDLLYMGNIVSSDAPDTYTTVVKALEFFAQKYQEDPAFAQRVDDAVQRILTAKYRLYGSFAPAGVTPPEANLALLGQYQATTFEIARQSATLLSPGAEDLATVLATPPSVRDHITFLSDVRSERQCSTCPDIPLMPVDALQNAILRLYGPQGGGQVMAGRLVSFSLESIGGILDGGAGNPELETSLRSSRWVVINLLDEEPGQKRTILLQRFLSERQELLRDKNVIVFAFNAPFYLDATDISKLTAYYCLYGRSAPFVEIAARLLFQELAPMGTLPVSVSGVGYDLFSMTTPAPDQVIQLYLDEPGASNPTSPQVLEPTATSVFNVGDTVGVRTGVILDHNNHPVPDGTGVQFMVASTEEGGVIQVFDTATNGGIARISFKIDRPGLLEVRAASEPATTSVVLQLGVSGEGLSVTIVAPTPVLAATPTAGAPVPPGTGPLTPLEQGHPGFGSWLLMLFVLGGLSYFAYWFGTSRISVRWGVRWLLCTAAGGLVAYTGLTLRMPFFVNLLQKNGSWGVILVVLLGAGAGFGSAFAWLRLRERRA